MENLKQYDTIKDYMRKLQLDKINNIIETVLLELGISKQELLSKGRTRIICDARRKIAYLARITYNIEGKLITEVLQLHKEWVYGLIYTAFNILQVDKEYRREMEELLLKLESKTTYN